jgi:nitroreductase
VHQGSTSPEMWNISESEFPKYSSTYDKLKFFLRYAILAPSIHNTQPWSFRIQNDNTIDPYADRKRALPVLDPLGRDLTISCGIVLGLLTDNYWSFWLRFKLLDAIGKEKGFPQILLGIGYSRHDIRPFPKRDVEEILGT